MPASWEPCPGKSQAVDAAVLRGRLSDPLFTKTRALDLHGLASFVIAAHRTGVMGQAHGPALGTARQANELQGEMTAPFALARLWIAFLW